MRTLLLYLCLLFAGMAGAQTVNIPDSNFKNALLASSPSANNAIAKNSSGVPVVVDTNGDGEIQVSEAQAVWEISTTYNEIASLEGIASFTSLRKLSCIAENLTSLDVSMLLELDELDCQQNDLTVLQFTSGLDKLNCRYNALTTLNVQGMSQLTYLDCTGNQLTQLNTTGLTALNTLYCGYNSIAPALNLSGSPAIQVVRCEYNLLTSLVVANLQTLNILYCGNNQLTELETGNMPGLHTLSIIENEISAIDLSQCPNIQQFYGHGLLSYINLKNGPNVPLIFNVSSDVVNELYVCIDEGEQAAILQFVTNGVIPSYTQVSSYCTFEPGGAHNTISGTLIFDAGNNGCDSTDPYIHFGQVSINDGTTTGLASYNAAGTYSFYTQAGTFTLTPQFENNWFTASPVAVTFISASGNTAVQNFCVTANGTHPDLEVAIVPLVPARPGFDAVYKILYHNKGNQTLSGDVTFNYNDAVLDYVSATPAESAAATGSLSWSYYNLLPFEGREIVLTLNVNSPQETPAVNIGDDLIFSATVSPLTDDEVPGDNSFGFKQTVVGSYDPNDITCLEGATVSPEKIGDYLHYNINFENTGTYPASFVIVKDIINTAKFDVSSLKVLNASHAVEVRVTGNKAEFYFDNINLAANGGKGNVTFKIKSLENLAVNSSVMQKADIFFDYNWPIVTNEATTTFALLSNTGFTKDAWVKVYPNPATNSVAISAESNIQSVQLFDVQGRLLEATSVNDINTTLDISSRANGIYFVKITTDKGVKAEKLVKE
jgi:Secretion system C-terminal sorting domain